MDFIALCKEAHQIAVDHGWWEQDRSELEIMALIHSEVSEAVEECRKGRPSVYWFGWSAGMFDTPREQKIISGFKDGVKPEGELIELADVCIRIFDWIGNISVSRIEIERQKYNQSAPSAIVKPIEFYGALHRWLENIELGFIVGKIEQWCAARGWNLEEAITRKMEYNRTRPTRHGGKLH